MDMIEFIKMSIHPVELQPWHEQIIRDINLMSEQELHIWRDCMLHGIGRTAMLRLERRFDWSKTSMDDLSHVPMNRVNGEVVCGFCGVLYRDHPYEERILNAIDDDPFLVQLCDGTLGKL